MVVGEGIVGVAALSHNDAGAKARLLVLTSLALAHTFLTEEEVEGPAHGRCGDSALLYDVNLHNAGQNTAGHGAKHVLHSFCHRQGILGNGHRRSSVCKGCVGRLPLR